MAIQRIPGELLQSNLTRQGVDLAFETNLLFLDVSNARIGIGTDSPGFKLDVVGNTRITGNQTITGNLEVQGTTTTIDSRNLTVEDNVIVLNSGSSQATSAGVMINRGASNPALFYWDEANDKFKLVTTASDGSTTSTITDTAYAKLAGADPTDARDFVTKNYFDVNTAGFAGSGSVIGSSIPIGSPSDSSFGDGALITLGDAHSVTGAIDDLNETMENIRANTFVKSVSFVADTTAASSGTTITLTITTVGGGANRYTITWGDGDTTTATSDSTPSHTYTATGSMTVTVKAFNNTAVTDSAGSFATSTRTNYITIFTATPVPNFFIYAASSGGSAITKADTGSTVYLENTSTNTSGATVNYRIDWGDGNSQSVTSDSDPGGVGGGRLSHTYNNSGADDGSTIAGTGTGDTRYAIRLVLEAHSTAAPSDIPTGITKNFDVYSTHTVLYSAADSTVRGVNEESTSGFPVTFTNNTATNPGAQSVFSSNVYSWNFGEGAGATNVNVGSGSSGDTGQTISNTFNLSTAQQNAKTTVTYTTTLSLANEHTSSPFAADMKIIVEPDVRANIAATAVTVSNKSGDDAFDLYDFTDLAGNNRALVRFTNTSQHADDYTYDFKDDSSDTLSIGEDGSTAGTIGATLDKNFSGTSNGSFTTRFRAHGTPDTIEQDDEETITFTMNAVPAAPSNLSTFSLTLSDSSQGTSPKLCASFTDNTGSLSNISAGTSLSSSTARRYTSGTIDTAVVNNAYNGATGTLTANINGSATGAKSFSTSTGENGTFTSLVVSGQDDANTTISSSTYPSNFYQTFDAKITQALTSYSVGLNAQRLEHSATGNTNVVHVLRDDISATPTISNVGTLAQNASGTLRYIAGVPYYSDDGSQPTLNLTGVQVQNLTGQAYTDQSNIVEVDYDTRSEGSSGNAISNTDYTYSDIDGASTMLSGGTPVTDTGVASAYTLGTLSINVDQTSSTKAVNEIKIRARNANGTGSYNTGSSTKIQVYNPTPTGLDNEQGGITVSDSLGATHDDDALRIYDFAGQTTDTPSFAGGTNFYTNNLFTGAKTVAGTREAGVRFGTITHETTDYSTFLPVGPDRSSDTNTQYFTIAFRRSTMANFNVTLSGTVSGMFIAAPGTAIDNASGLNGWLDCSTTYGGSGVPGSDTGNGGNGSNGCAFNSGDRVVDGTSYSSQEFTFTLGTENGTNATGNVILIRIKLNSGDSVTALAID